MLWDSTDGTPLQVLSGHEGTVRACAVSSNGQLASASADKSVIVWDPVTGKPQLSLAGHRDWVNGCEFDPSGTLLASVSNDRTLRLWDLRTRSRKVAVIAHGQWVNCCAFSPDSQYIVSAAADGTITRWSLGFDEAIWESWLSGSKYAEQALRPLELPRHKKSVNQVAFAPDGSFMVSASSDETLRLWDIARGVMLGTLVGHGAPVNGCEVSPDSSLVASASADGALKVWRASNAECLMTVHVDGELTACSWIQNGSALVAVGALGVYFFKVAGAR